MLKKNKTKQKESMEKSFQINAIAPVILCHETLNYMCKDSSIILIGSTLSEIAVPGSLSYVASKHALSGIMKGITQDLFHKNINTCLICPGFTNTEMLQSNAQASNNPKQFYNFINNMQSIGRCIEPCEIAQTIFHVCYSNVINGAILHINGGQKAA